MIVEVNQNLIRPQAPTLSNLLCLSFDQCHDNANKNVVATTSLNYGAFL